MRTRHLWSISLGLALAIAATATLWTGCAGKKQTEIVVGVLTQMRVPADIQTVRLNVNAGGPVVFDQVYPVYNGVVLLPQTLALAPGAQQSSVTITVLGYKLTQDDPYFDTMPPASDPETQILRRSVVQYAPSRIVYLPMPLRYACYQVACGDSQTCVAGQCVDAKVDSAKLANYSDDLVFGTTSSCFSVTSCFAAEEPAVVVDPNRCIFTIPGAPGAPTANDAGPFPLPAAPGGGINVRVQYEDLETEVLDLDPVEGFSIPDPSMPQTFQLPQGLCNQYIAASDPTMPAPHKIVSVGVTALCQTKAINQPLCASDVQDNGQLPDAAPGPGFVELKRPTSLLYLMVDDSADLGSYYGATAFSQVMKLTLSDPLFQSVQVAFAFFPEMPGCSVILGPEVPFEDAGTAKRDIANALNAPRMPSGNILGADHAIGEASATIQQWIMMHPGVPVATQAIVMITGNNPETGNCATPDGGLMAPASASVYVVQVPVQDSSTQLQASDVQALVDGGAGGQFFPGTTMASAASAFTMIAADLTSCTYLNAPGMDMNGALSYVNPISLMPVLIPHLPGPACGSDSAWFVDPKDTFVKLCPSACNDLRTAIIQRTLLTSFEGNPPPAPPDLPVFAQQTAQDN